MFIGLEIGISFRYRRSVIGEPDQLGVMWFNRIKKSTPFVRQIILGLAGPAATIQQGEC